MKTILKFFLFLFVMFCNAQNFNTAGNGIRNTVIGKIDNKNVLYISEIDGAISCYTIKGEKIWRNESQNSALLFEIVAADIDGDGDDDILAASGDGNLYCWKSNGTLMWKFNPGIKVRLSEVAFVKNGNHSQIFTGGNNYKLYEVDLHGKLVSETAIKGVVRKIESGKFINSTQEVLFLFTLKHDKFGSDFFGFIDPVTKKKIKEKDINDILGKTYRGIVVQDISVADINKNGTDEILIFGSKGGATYTAIDGNLTKVGSYISPNKDNQRYAHTIGTCLLPFKDEIVIQMGGLMYVTDLDGNLKYKQGERYKGIIYNDLVFDDVSKQLIAGGQIGGGNGVYFYKTSKKKWWEKEHELIGRMKEVKTNLEKLYQQALSFKTPKYQKKNSKDFIMITGVKENSAVKKIKNQKIIYPKQFILSESTPRTELAKKIGGNAYKIDKRKKYNLSRKQIISIAKKQEKNNEPFTLWAGHGTDPFITQLETLEQIIKVAPTTCYGFTYAEMANTKDPRVIYFVRHCVPRLAKVIRDCKSPAKLYFRYKGMFWGADSHAKLWSELFFSNKYNDILIPSAEDTNNRLQDLNFSGRVGMLVSGYVNDYAMRLVDDNPTSWRPLSPGGQRSISPYLRNAAIMASYGSRYGLLFNISYLEEPGYNILFALMKSGIIPFVEKEDMLSIGAWHLIKEVDEEYLDIVNKGHNLCTYTPEDSNNVVSVASLNWCGATIPKYDYSKIAMGVKYRWLNFMPETPNGMIPITHVNYASVLEKKETPYFVSNIKKGYVNDQKVDGKTFGPVMENKINKAAKKLPVKITGASWSAIKLDQNHTRLVLVDPGYVDPQNCDATITILGNTPTKITDILSKETLILKENKVKLIIPAGSMRFIDLEY